MASARIHQPQQLVHQLRRLLIPRGEAQLRAAVVGVRRSEGIAEPARDRCLERFHDVRLARHARPTPPLLRASQPKCQRGKCVGQPGQIFGGGGRLHGERVLLASTDPRVVKRRVLLHEGKRAIVERDAAERRVVAVHVALAVADAQPSGEQQRLPGTHLVKHPEERAACERRRLRSIRRLLRRAIRRPARLEVRKLALEGVRRELLEEVELLTLRKELHLPEAQERGRHSRAHRAGLATDALLAGLSVPVTSHGLAGGQQAQRARRRDPERCHRLLPEEFTHGGAQHRPPVGSTAVWSHARALELDLFATHLTDGDGPSIAALPAESAEEASAVHGGPGIEVVRRRATEHAKEKSALAHL